MSRLYAVVALGFFPGGKSPLQNQNRGWGVSKNEGEFYNGKFHLINL